MRNSPESHSSNLREIEAVFSVDVEDYFQVTAFEDSISRDEWSSFSSRVVENTHRILDILSRNAVQGTFFVLGWTAERYPQLVRDILSAGHEIGSHSFWHYRVYNQTPHEFRDDLRRSRDVLSSITGHAIVAYRAPTFSIVRRSLWALEILIEEGFQIDSSVFPIRHDRYGVSDARRDLHQITTKTGNIWEFPPTVVSWGKYNLPVAGGGYFRLYPYWLTGHGIRYSRKQCGGPAMFYIHPWEVDPDQPRLTSGSRISRFRHYVNLGSTVTKLQRLLREFRFGSLRDVISAKPAIANSLV